MGAFAKVQVALVVKTLPANTGDERDVGLIPGSGRSPGVRNGNPPQNSCLESLTDRGALAGYSPWGRRVGHDWAHVCVRLTHTHAHTHTEVLMFYLGFLHLMRLVHIFLLLFLLIFGIKVIWCYVAEPWWLRPKRICPQCRRPRFDPWVWKIPWSREWLPTPVFLPEEFHGQRSLVGYSPWDHKEWDTSERLTHTHTHTHQGYVTKSGVWLLTAQKPIQRPGWRKGKFAFFWMPATQCWGKGRRWTSVWRPRSPHWQSEGKSFYRRREGAICRNSTVSWQSPWNWSSGVWPVVSWPF